MNPASQEMTEYDLILGDNPVPWAEIPHLVSCLCYVAYSDGVFSDAENSFLGNILKYYGADQSIIDQLSVGSGQAPDYSAISKPEVVVLLSLMLAYVDGTYSSGEITAVATLAANLKMPQKRLDDLHLAVKKKVYAEILKFYLSQNGNSIRDVRSQLDEQRDKLELSHQMAIDIESRIANTMPEQSQV